MESILPVKRRFTSKTTLAVKSFSITKLDTPINDRLGYFSLTFPHAACSALLPDQSRAGKHHVARRVGAESLQAQRN